MGFPKLHGVISRTYCSQVTWQFSFQVFQLSLIKKKRESLYGVQFSCISCTFCGENSCAALKAASGTHMHPLRRSLKYHIPGCTHDALIAVQFEYYHLIGVVLLPIVRHRFHIQSCFQPEAHHPPTLEQMNFLINIVQMLKKLSKWQIIVLPQQVSIQLQ